jgi:hypothetical protein
MIRSSWLKGVGTLGLLFCLAGVAWADRVPMNRNTGMRSHGTRFDLTVPYLTTGRTAFGAYSVGPRIYSSPVVEDAQHPGTRPVFNLIFYGAVQSFGDRSNGAMPRPR